MSERVGQCNTVRRKWMIVFKRYNAYKLAALLANRFRKLCVPLWIFVASIVRRRHQQQCVTLQFVCL
jgi:hypothetical protein